MKSGYFAFVVSSLLLSSCLPSLIQPNTPIIPVVDSTEYMNFNISAGLQNVDVQTQFLVKNKYFLAGSFSGSGLIQNELENFRFTFSGMAGFKPNGEKPTILCMGISAAVANQIYFLTEHKDYTEYFGLDYKSNRIYFQYSDLLPFSKKTTVALKAGIQMYDPLRFSSSLKNYFGDLVYGYNLRYYNLHVYSFGLYFLYKKNSQLHYTFGSKFAFWDPNSSYAYQEITSSGYRHLFTTSEFIFAKLSFNLY